MRFLLIHNSLNEKTRILTFDAASYIVSKGGVVLGQDGGYSIEMLPHIPSEYLFSCDCALVFGGDGTMLAAVRFLATYDLPVCGVNMGRVGFLSTIEKSELRYAIDHLLSGDFCIRPRMMVHGQVQREGCCIAEYEAFNEFVIRSGELSRAISYSVNIDSQHVNNYIADGIIVATPTGSTGYSLSAGGPIVLDDIEMLLITPVCAQSFFSRPIVTSAFSQVEILCSGSRDRPSLTADGQCCFSLQRFDRVRISASKHKAKIVRLRQENYFDRIKQKLYQKS